MKIAFIGTGIMGSSMASNLLKKGHEVFVYNRTKEKAQNVINNGATWCGSVKECVSDKDMVITMVGYPKDVRKIYFSSEGILENCKKGCYIIDMTTTSPELSVEIYESAKQKGVFALDAPVTGGDIGAREATLTVLVGGDKDVFENCKDILSALGKNIIYSGKAGMGQHMKMCNQIALAGIISSICEAISYADKKGLDVSCMLNTLGNGAAGSWQMLNTAPRILKGEFDTGFLMKHYIKDMGIALDEAKKANLDLKVLDLVCMLYKEVYPKHQNEATQSLIKYYTDKY